MKKHIIYFILILSILLSSCGSQESVSSQANQSTEPSGQCQSHTDVNNNGLCDNCNVSVVVIVDFYNINDLHGKFDDTNEQPGVDELTTYLKQKNHTDDYTVFLSSGDMWQGSSESNMTKGKLITEWMNQNNFTAMTLGNHEYDWGEDYIEKNSELANFPFLAINIYDKDTNTRVEYADASVMIERGGVKIGIIGAIGDCYSSISAEWTEGIYFKTGRELTELVKAESEKLKSEGADFIVYSLHDGYNKNKTDGSLISDNRLSSYYDVELSNGYVDLVFEGHTHKKYTLKDKYGVYHLQNGGDNQGISHVEAEINFANDTKKTSVAEFVSTNNYVKMSDDPSVDALLEKYDDTIKKAYQVVGNTPTPIPDGELKKLVAKLYFDAGIKKWGEKYNLALGGGYISVRSPYTLDAGEITYSELYMLLPFDNRLVLCSIKGDDLSSRFFNTSSSDYYISYGEYGDSIKNNIDPNQTYYIITDTYCSQYKPNKLTVIEYYDDETFARDLVADYFEGK